MKHMNLNTDNEYIDAVMETIMQQMTTFLCANRCLMTYDCTKPY